MILLTTIISSCVAKTGRDDDKDSSAQKPVVSCDNDIRSYEFGREMAATKELLGYRDFEDAIAHFNSATGTDFSFMMNNECAIKGYNDRLSNIASPYNKEGKAWTEFK